MSAPHALDKSGSDGGLVGLPAFRFAIGVHIIRKEYPLDELVRCHRAFGRDQQVDVHRSFVLDASAKAQVSAQ